MDHQDREWHSWGQLDEAVRYNRQVSEDAAATSNGDAHQSFIRAVHARGALDLALRVRVCEQADCADDPPFVGPSGATSAYEDPAGQLAPPSSLPLSGLAPGRYFQYEAQLQSRRAGLEPELYVVTVRATE